MVKKKIQNNQKFVILLICSLFFIAAMIVLSIFIGAEKSVTFKDFINALFNYNDENFNETIIRNIRIPRIIADIMVGACLAVAGAIMQGTTKNPMADSGIMGISSGSVFSIIIIMVFFPNISRLGRIGFSCLGALVVTLLIYTVAFIGRKGLSSDRMVLSGMAISTLFSSVTTAVVLKTGQSGEMMKYMAGSAANTIWLDVYVSLPFFIVSIVISIAISRSLTILNLGDEVSKGLGGNVTLIKTLSTIVVLVLSAIAVVIIGPVGYVGLMVPHIVRHICGTDYRYVIPSCALLGAAFVLFVDFIAKNIMPGFEFPIGLLITIIGVPFFIFASRRTDENTFNG